MSFYKAQIIVPMDTTLPRDVTVVTPHFNCSGGTPTAQALADNLAAKVKTWIGTVVPVTVKIYDATGLPPHYPLATTSQDSASPVLVSTVPREVALCLSYYSVQNVRRQRGRLYLPATWCIKSGGSSGVVQRPTAAIYGAALNFGTNVLKAQTAIGAQWGFWSERDNQFRAVTNYWVDDEWDTQRRRGLRSTLRVTGTA